MADAGVNGATSEMTDGAGGDALAGACRDLRERARRGVAWVNDGENVDTVGLARADIDKRLRKLAVEAGKLEAAVARPMCVGVFGPSQAGKSYLVSVLARPGEEPLMIRFGDGEADRDYIRDINPGGDRESTGVVTRFSVREEPVPDGFPVRLRLLSEIDVAKVLVNAYHHDVDSKGVDPIAGDALRAVLERAREAAGGGAGSGAGGTAGPSAEDLWDLQGYFEALFEGSALKDRMAGFWDEAAIVAGGLDVAGRAALLAPAWGSIPQLTGLYEALVGALERLGHAADAHCTMEALVPRERSIIDVATLKNHLGTPDQPSLRVRGGRGEVDMPLAVVTALTAELRLTIGREPWPFFAATDLLDFPGARSRQPKPVERLFGETAGEDGEPRNPLAELFLRGKVAYLFERYVAEQELTSMLLCVGPGPLEVVDLPRVVGDWIARTHGATPAERAAATTVLFFVLTKFDVHFGAKAGEERADPGERFASRVNSSLLERFDEGWTKAWRPGEPFDNCFWLRNPNYPADAIIDYDEAGREIEIKPAREGYIADLRAGSARVPEVRAHFREPERAFDEALRLNDGGVSYLAAALEPVCRPDLKRRQVELRRTALVARLHALLSPFHVSSDLETRLAERRAVSRRLLARLRTLFQEGRYARVLDRLFVSQQALWSLLYDARPDARSDVRSDAADDGLTGRTALAGTTATDDALALPGDPLALPGGAPAPMAAAAPEGAGGTDAGASVPTANCRRAGLAAAAVAHWLSHIRAEAEGDALIGLMGDATLADELVAELAQAARRTGLHGRVAAAIERLAGPVDEDLGAVLEKATLVAANEVNRFVTRFDYESMAPDERPVAPAPAREGTPVFQRTAPVASCARDLDGPRVDHRTTEFSHWMYAFHDLVERNAQSVDGSTVNVEQNAALGALIAGLAPAGATAGSVR